MILAVVLFTIALAARYPLRVRNQSRFKYAISQDAKDGTQSVKGKNCSSVNLSSRYYFALDSSSKIR